MPILAFVLTVGIGSLLYLFASFLFGTSFSDACSALVGFAAMLGVSLVMSAAYRKGFKKTVLAMGLSGAVFGLPFITPDPRLPSIIRALLTRSSMTAVIYWKNNADIIISGN